MQFLHKFSYLVLLSSDAISKLLTRRSEILNTDSF